MKKLITLFVCTAMYMQLSFAQQVDALVTDFNLTFMAGESGDFDYIKFSGKGVAVTVMYKAKDGTTLYTESHEGTLDELAQITFVIGLGSNPQPPLVTNDLLTQIATFCWNGTIETDDGPKPFDGMKNVTPTNFANYSYFAGSSERWADNTFYWDPITQEDIQAQYLNTSLIVRQPDDANPLNWFMRELPMIEFMNFSELPSAVNNNTIISQNFFISDAEEHAWSFGIGNANTVENKFTFFATSSPNFYNGVGFINQQGAGDPGHNTAALFACNEEPNLSGAASVGVHAKGNSWAGYFEGKNGALGISTTAGSGSGLSGLVGVEPASGFFGYGVYANSNSLANAYGLVGFGPGFNTGVFPIGSDARLKNEIRPQTTVLEKVMQLKPSLYSYKQEIPYGFPEGLHHGFIAQEMEEVFPELISDIALPASMDPEKMLTSGSVSYKAINYIEMVSILTSALQELNTNLTSKIDAQALEIAELRKMIEEIATRK